MRLLKLKLKNIASLKGEHLIEFDKLTNESPLFAITGETGSGKSTILNSVAMALYGRVYKSSLTQADIVTLGEREGQIQLIFKIKGQNYLAEWKGRIRRPNGEVLKKPTLDRYIQKLDGEDFSDSRSGDNLSADEILNLNFDQFCKCIILNQGEFSKFSTACPHPKTEQNNATISNFNFITLNENVRFGLIMLLCLKKSQQR